MFIPRMLAASVLCACVSQAQASTLHIDPQPLSSALTLLATRAGIQILFDPAVVSGVRAPSVRATRVPDALDTLLAGSGLHYRETAPGTYVVVADAAKPTQLSTVTVVGKPSVVDEEEAPGSTTYKRSISSVATKTDTPIMQTPTKVEVVTQQAIQDMGLNSRGFAEAMAALGIAGLGIGEGDLDNSFFFRGFQTSTTLWNGFRIETLGVASVNGGVWMDNVERLDMLRGASAILYGRAEPGGAINITTKKPRETFGGEIKAGFGTYANAWAAADVGGPVNAAGTLLFRLNAGHEEEDSRYRYGNDYRSTGFAPALELRLSPQTTLSFEGQFRNLEGSSNQPYIPLVPGTNTLLGVDPDQTLLPGAKSEFKQRRMMLGVDHQINDDWKLAWKYMYNDADMPLNLWSLVVGLYDPVNPGDPLLYEGWLTGSIGRQRTHATLLELTGKVETGALQHTLLFGIDHYKTRTQEDGIDKCFGCPPEDYFNPPALGPLSDYIDISDYLLTQRETSLYFQDQIAFRDRFHVLLGGRYQRLKEHSFYEDDFGSLENIPYKKNNFLPRAAVLWQPVPAMSLYYSYTENSGVSQGLDANNDPIKPELSIQHEVGAKFDLLEGRLIASAAVFDLTKDNVASTDSLSGQVAAIGRVNSKGLELSAQGALTDRWNILTTYNYARPVIKVGTENPPASAAGASALTAGNKLPYFSQHAFSVLTRYRLPVEGWTAGGSYNWFSAPIMDESSSVKSEAYQTVSAFVSYQTRLGGYQTTFQLNVDNLFDEEYLLYQGDFGVPYAADPTLGFGYTGANYVGGNWGAPRQVRLGLRMAF